MTIIVFLIDSSASMNQKTFIGARPSMLDIAKGAVETFVKLRQRSPESRGDRYMLFTSEESPHHIKAGWKENLATFMNELKNIRAYGLSTLGGAVKNVFDVLNINRMQSGIDTYGMGRSPFFLEPSVIVVITDGGKLSSPQGVQEDIFPLPKMHPIPGAELTKEIFRWDQRIFGLVLRMSGTPTTDALGLVPSDNSSLDKLCEQTGGRTYAVRTHRMFQQCIDSLVQKVQSGVVINFEKIGPDPPAVILDGNGKDLSDIIELDKENQQNNFDPAGQPLPPYPAAILNSLGTAGGILGAVLQNGSRPHTPNPMQPTTGVAAGANNAWHNCRKMIYVPRPAQRGSPSGFWPIPESFWPDLSTMSLPARSAHPNVKFTCTSQDPMVIDSLPFDKYELEPSPLTQFILSRKQPTICWQVYIPNSSKNSDVGHPFGYLKASTSLQCVNLFVMPYNYPVLLPLLDDLFKLHRGKPTKDWRQSFENYLRTMPPYYANPLKRALSRMGATNLVPDNLDNSLSFQVTNHLKRLKNQAKIEYERICTEVEKRLAQSNGCSSHEGIRVVPRNPLSRHLISNHIVQAKLSFLRDQVPEHSNCTLPVREDSIQPQMYCNAFDIPRSALLDQLTRMRANFLQTSVRHMLTTRDEDQLHCRPISAMGNYQDYLKKLTPPLRELECAPLRQHMFGNPFKIDKKMSMMVDEADVDMVGSAGSVGRGTKRIAESPPQFGRPNKRRRGPLPPDVTLQRIMGGFGTSSIPPPSPCPPSPYSPQWLPDGEGEVGEEERSQEAWNEVNAPTSYESLPMEDVSLPPPPVNPTYGSDSVGISPPGSPLSLTHERTGRESPPLVNGELSHLSNNNYPDDFSVISVTQNDIAHLPPPPALPPPSPPPTSLPTPLPAVAEVPTEPRNGLEVKMMPLAVDSINSSKYNRELMRSCFKELKTPGRDFTRLFEKLNTVQGCPASRLTLVHEVIMEASRFKRHALVKLLNQFADSMKCNGEQTFGLGRGNNNVVRLNGHTR